MLRTPCRLASGLPLFLLSLSPLLLCFSNFQTDFHVPSFSHLPQVCCLEILAFLHHVTGLITPSTFALKSLFAAELLAALTTVFAGTIHFYLPNKNQGSLL